MTGVQDLRVHTFRSTAYPDAPAGLVYARALSKPLAACVLPVMTIATAAALLGEPVLTEALWGMAAALVVAAGWARFDLRRTVAEVRVRGGEASLRTVWACLHGQPASWVPVLDVRSTGGVVGLGAGDAEMELDGAYWPQQAALLEALADARAHRDREGRGVLTEADGQYLRVPIPSRPRSFQPTRS